MVLFRDIEVIEVKAGDMFLTGNGIKYTYLGEFFVHLAVPFFYGKKIDFEERIKGNSVINKKAFFIKDQQDGKVRYITEMDFDEIDFLQLKDIGSDPKYSDIETNAMNILGDFWRDLLLTDIVCLAVAGLSTISKENAKQHRFHMQKVYESALSKYGKTKIIKHLRNNLNKFPFSLDLNP